MWGRRHLPPEAQGERQPFPEINKNRVLGHGGSLGPPESLTVGKPSLASASGSLFGDKSVGALKDTSNDAWRYHYSRIHIDVFMFVFLLR